MYLGATVLTVCPRRKSECLSRKNRFIVRAVQYANAAEVELRHSVKNVGRAVMNADESDVMMLPRPTLMI